jgi:OmpA-OmpF porin, OOP family
MPLGDKKMPLRKILVAAALAALAAPALADSPRWYAGISAGESRTSNELVTNRETTIVDAVSVQTDFDSKDSAWKAFGGFRFNDLVAVEINYADLGRHHLTTNLVGGDPPAPGLISLGRKISGFGADVVLCAPLGQRFGIFGKVGAFRSRLVADSQLEGNVVFTNAPASDRARSVTLNETVVKFGVGGDWWFTQNAALRLEWERYHNIGKAFQVGGTGTTGEADTDMLSLGVMMRF